MVPIVNPRIITCRSLVGFGCCLYNATTYKENNVPHRNWILQNFFGDTKKINYLEIEPTMKNRTFRSMGVKAMKRDPKTDKVYIRCEKCRGEGVWRNEHAVTDMYHSEPGRLTCFSCGAKNNGWFLCPDVNHYLQNLFLWSIFKMVQNQEDEVWKVAKSECEYLWSLPENPYIREIVWFWLEMLLVLPNWREGRDNPFGDHYIWHPMPAPEKALEKMFNLMNQYQMVQRDMAVMFAFDPYSKTCVATSHELWFDAMNPDYDNILSSGGTDLDEPDYSDDWFDQPLGGFSFGYDPRMPEDNMNENVWIDPTEDEDNMNESSRLFPQNEETEEMRINGIKSKEFHESFFKNTTLPKSVVLALWKAWQK